MLQNKKENFLSFRWIVNDENVSCGCDVVRSSLSPSNTAKSIEPQADKNRERDKSISAACYCETFINFNLAQTRVSQNFPSTPQRGGRGGKEKLSPTCPEKHWKSQSEREWTENCCVFLSENELEKNIRIAATLDHSQSLTDKQVEIFLVKLLLAIFFFAFWGK